MQKFRTILLLSFVLSSCQEETNETPEELEDCPAIALGCPEGQVECDIETDNDPCAEVVLGEEPCTQTRYCTPE